ncbi:UNVERIFIED_CONTAM: hypothetical protein K2H54_046247 [Gekko kuhli]
MVELDLRTYRDLQYVRNTESLMKGLDSKLKVATESQKNLNAKSFQKLQGGDVGFGQQAFNRSFGVQVGDPRGPLCCTVSKGGAEDPCREIKGVNEKKLGRQGEE